MGILENYVKTISLQIKVIWDIVKIIQMCLPIPDKMRKQLGLEGEVVWEDAYEFTGSEGCKVEKGEVLFSEEAALDHLTEFGVWPRDNYFGEDPNEPFDD